jgi:hypothetical protein
VAVMAWCLLADPSLRSALEYAATRADCARQRARWLRRRITLGLVLATVIALSVRGVLALVV